MIHFSLNCLKYFKIQRFPDFLCGLRLLDSFICSIVYYTVYDRKGIISFIILLRNTYSSNNKKHH